MTSQLVTNLVIMNLKKITIWMTLLVLTACTSKSTLEFLDPIPASEEVQVFAKGNLSKLGTREGNVVLSPNGQLLLYIAVDTAIGPQIYQRTFQGRQWSAPKRVSFSDQGENYEPFFTGDGRYVYFVSNRSTGEKWNGRIWRVERTGQDWSEPTLIDIPIAENIGLWFPSVSPSGLIYFGASLTSFENYGKSDLYSFDPETNEVKNITALNTPAEEWDPFIAADGSYIIFASDRPGTLGAVDHYISFKTNMGWGTPINMGPTINSPHYDVAAKVTPDGKYILFDRPLDDDQDVYWIKADIINKLQAEQEQ